MRSKFPALIFNFMFMKSETITRFFTKTGNILSCEARKGAQNLFCMLNLDNGSFKLERSSFNLLDAVSELKIILAVAEQLLSE